MVTQFLAGGSAGVVQWLPPIYSLDVIKSRMQAYPQGYYKSWIDCAVKVYKEEGIQIFYRFANIYTKKICSSQLYYYIQL